MAEPWVDLIASDDVGPGQVVGVAVDGLDLVVWRGETGQARVVDARCPHQWSHLGFAGLVDGDELLCSTHGWRFDDTGAGWKLNLVGRRDRKGDIAVYPCVERSGRILVQLPDASAPVGDP